MAPLMNTVIKKLALIIIGTAVFAVSIKAQFSNAVAYPTAESSLNLDALNNTKLQQPTFKQEKKISRQQYVLQAFDVFGETGFNDIYQITIAADVPDNNRPAKVFFKKEPGHVFIILEKKDTVTGKSIAKVWGFYPVKPVSCLIFRKTKSILTDNSSREYNAAITRRLSVAEFNLVKLKAASLVDKKYHINKYNCYDYALEIFNALPGDQRLPLRHIKFPFVFGSGGSPCGLYEDLVKLKNSESVLASSIYIGIFEAPKSKPAAEIN